jgi:hypothetical protein
MSESEVHLYALLAQPALPVAAQPKGPNFSKLKPSSTEPTQLDRPKTAAEQLRGTPTLIVPPATVSQFAATDFPLLIATDSKGIIRFIQPASETALNTGDFLDQITTHIAKQWPRQTPASPTAPSTATKP